MMVQKLAQKLTENGLDVQIIQDIEELVWKAEQYLADGQLRTVVSAGGDGTVSLLVNRLPAEVPYFVFPLGTANLLANYLKINLDIDRAVAQIIAGRTVRLDVGKANDRLFLVVASIGFDADVVHRLHAARKGHISYATYFLPVARSIFGYDFPAMNLVADGERLNDARWTFVFNIPRYAIGLRMIEDANGQDGLLDACTFAGGGFFTGLGYFFSVLFRRHRSLKATQIARFQSLEVSSEADVPVPVELDGDPAGTLPISIGVVPERIRVVVGEDWEPS